MNCSSCLFRLLFMHIVMCPSFVRYLFVFIFIIYERLLFLHVFHFSIIYYLFILLFRSLSHYIDIVFYFINYFSYFNNYFFFMYSCFVLWCYCYMCVLYLILCFFCRCSLIYVLLSFSIHYICSWRYSCCYLFCVFESVVL